MIVAYPVIVATNDARPRAKRAHLQAVDMPNVSVWTTRGFALCGIEMVPRNYTWCEVPPPVGSDVAIAEQGWSVCLDCVLQLL